MKTIIKFVLLCFIAYTTQAQKVIEKEISIQADNINLDFKFADNISLKTWNKEKVFIKAEAIINNNKDNNFFELKINNNKSVLFITSDYGDLFKTKNNTDNCNTSTRVQYTVYLPKNLDVKVKSISGNVSTDQYDGTLIVDIISGNINIKNYSGALNLKTISGDIDINVATSTLKANTITGQIYADKSMSFDKTTSNVVGYNVSGTFGKALHQLQLNTISGDIYIRKK